MPDYITADVDHDAKKVDKEIKKLEAKAKKIDNAKPVDQMTPRQRAMLVQDINYFRTAFGAIYARFEHLSSGELDRLGQIIDDVSIKELKLYAYPEGDQLLDHVGAKGDTYWDPAYDGGDDGSYDPDEFQPQEGEYVRNPRYEDDDFEEDDEDDELAPVSVFGRKLK